MIDVDKYTLRNVYASYDCTPIAFTAIKNNGGWTELYFFIAEVDRDDGSMAFMARKMVNPDGREVIVEQADIDFSELNK